MKRTKYTLGCAAAALSLVAFWLTPKANAFGADSPIIVRDGSIAIEHQGGDLNKWSLADRTALEHPDQSQDLGSVEVTGPGAKSATCAGRGRCVVEMKWSSGHGVRVISKAAGNKGMRLEGIGVTFDDPAWDKSAPEWRYKLPANSVPTITIRDQATNGKPKVICQGTGCRMIVHYQ